MSNEKRVILCVLLIFVWVTVAPTLLRSLGLMPPPPKKAAPAPAATVDAAKEQMKPGDDQAVAKAEAEQSRAGAASADSRPEPAKGADAAKKAPETASEAAKPGKPGVVPVEEQELVLGSASDKSPAGYRLEVQLQQKGAGVESVASSRYDAEFEGRKNPHLPLQLVRRDPFAQPSLALTLSTDVPAAAEAEKPETESDTETDQPKPPSRTEDLLDSVLWDVVRDDQGRVVVPLTGTTDSGKEVEGQQVSFRTKAANEVVVTKTFRLWKETDGLELEIRFDSPDQERAFSYNLLGPHGIPIEGEWYTGTFREAFFATYDQGKIKVSTHTANDIVKASRAGKPIESTTLPLRFTGIENQYFALLMTPAPAPTSEADRIDRETLAIVLHEDPKALQKSDVGVRMTSRPLKIGPNVPAVHTFRIFTGPKTDEALSDYAASSLVSYRKSSYIPYASTIARYVIAPTLSFTYQVTRRVAALFGRQEGNWGMAIILLTLLVKMIMFPLGRKQAPWRSGRSSFSRFSSKFRRSTRTTRNGKPRRPSHFTRSMASTP